MENHHNFPSLPSYSILVPLVWPTKYTTQARVKKSKKGAYQDFYDNPDNLLCASLYIQQV